MLRDEDKMACEDCVTIKDVSAEIRYRQQLIGGTGSTAQLLYTLSSAPGSVLETPCCDCCCCCCCCCREAKGVARTQQ